MWPMPGNGRCAPATNSLSRVIKAICLTRCVFANAGFLSYTLVMSGRGNYTAATFTMSPMNVIDCPWLWTR